jgi:hypothetical protein
VETLHCLIADIPQIVLADIVQRITEENKNIEVVERVPSIEDVPAILSRQDIDVLILGMKSNICPLACKDILKKYSDLLIVGLVDDGRQAAIYIDDVGSNEIVKIIRTLGKR